MKSRIVCLPSVSFSLVVYSDCALGSAVVIGCVCGARNLVHVALGKFT